MDAFARDTQYYVWRLTDERTTVINFPNRGEVTERKLERMLMRGFAVVGPVHPSIVVVRVAYLMKHIDTGGLRYFYGSKNTTVFKKSLIVGNVDSIRNMPQRYINDLHNLKNVIANNQSRSGWEIEAITNVLTIWTRIRKPR